MTEPVFERNALDREFPLLLAERNGAQPCLYHWHDEIEILCGLERETVVGVLEHPYRLKEGDILIIGPRQNHCLFPSEREAKRLVLSFHPSLLFSKSAFAVDGACFSRIRRHSSQWGREGREAVEKSIAVIEREYRQREPGWREGVYAQLMLLAVAAIRLLPLETPEKRRSSQDDSLKRVLSYLSEHDLSSLMLKDCAEALGFNETYLSGLFKRQTGTTFHQYVLKLRLNQAEQLLENTNLSISAVSVQSGFSSVKTFHRVFHEQYGVTPGQYRDQIRAVLQPGVIGT